MEHNPAWVLKAILAFQYSQSSNPGKMFVVLQQPAFSASPRPLILPSVFYQRGYVFPRPRLQVRGVELTLWLFGKP